MLAEFSKEVIAAAACDVPLQAMDFKDISWANEFRVVRACESLVVTCSPSRTRRRMIFLLRSIQPAFSYIS